MSDNRAAVHLSIDPQAAESGSAVERSDAPFDVVVLGDFSARSSRGEVRPALDALRRVRVDRDDIDALIASLAPTVRLRFDDAAAPMDVQLREMDDFHPDSLHARSPLFERLRQLRRRATDPEQLQAVAAELGLADDASTEPPPPLAESGAAALEQILARTEPAGIEELAVTDLSGGGMNQLIRRLVAPHRVRGPDPRQAEVLASIDAAVAAGMRLVLHHAAFQELEALWRALHLLVSRVETGPSLHVEIVDLSRPELEADLAADPGAGGRLRELLGPDHASDEGPPALIVTAWRFGAEATDLSLLGRLARLGESVGAPCLTAGLTELVGAPATDALTDAEGWDDPPSGWSELRRLPRSRFLGVSLQRVLLRMPYGADADQCDSFDFEELSDPPRHDEFLWGNPAFACAALLASSFADAGWRMRPGALRDLEGLPIALVRAGGDVSTQPVAEVLLTEHAADRLLEAGVMPLASIRDRGVARVVRFQSIASPPAPLAGRWNVR